MFIESKVGNGQLAHKIVYKFQTTLSKHNAFMIMWNVNIKQKKLVPLLLKKGDILLFDSQFTFCQITFDMFWSMAFDINGQTWLVHRTIILHTRVVNLFQTEC